MDDVYDQGGYDMNRVRDQKETIGFNYNREDSLLLLKRRQRTINGEVNDKKEKVVRKLKAPEIFTGMS